MPIAVDEDQASAKSRIAAIRLALWTLRCMNNWRQNVGDYDSAMILIAVIAITAEKLTRQDVESELQTLDAAFPPERLTRCNISSIAAGTGLNRETTRRKVNALAAAGYLVRTADGGVEFAPGLLQAPSTLELVRTQLDGMARGANELIRDGILRLR
ncbi:hypothetical protein E2493_17810 [Sphingomonas parva]|uniref:HTH iclR-type domain-containing protein n=1 Tax=Sphingomonas parva TaxID=2555898 RepID=A0A4Y8ZNS7_9SPHN|nr:hypothetical protein [Sphingomonas parva]TFI56922.1 hypothetical protein E2493_17810 [Sphingomonas parva]